MGGLSDGNARYEPGGTGDDGVGRVGVVCGAECRQQINAELFMQAAVNRGQAEGIYYLGMVMSIATSGELGAVGFSAMRFGLTKVGFRFGANNTTRVGRWMSEAEYRAMLNSGRVQESYSGTTHVANPADATAFINQAKPGAYYVEFNVPGASLKVTNEGWAKVIGPNSLEGRLAARKGLPIPEMPPATYIEHLATRIP